MAITKKRFYRRADDGWARPIAPVSLAAQSASIGGAQFKQKGVPPVHPAVVAAIALERTLALSSGDHIDHRHRRDHRIQPSDSGRVGEQHDVADPPECDIEEFVTAMTLALFSFSHIAIWCVALA